MTITEIVSLVLRVVVFVLIVFIIPLIKRKYSKDQLEAVNETIQTYVEAAEQIFGKDDGEIKKQWVRTKLAAAGIDVDLDVIDAEIEAYVLMLHNALKAE